MNFVDPFKVNKGEYLNIKKSKDKNYQPSDRKIVYIIDLIESDKEIKVEIDSGESTIKKAVENLNNNWNNLKLDSKLFKHIEKITIAAKDL